MSTTTEQTITLLKVVSQAEWQNARDALLVKEKAATHARDALAAERRRLPMVKVEKDYVFDAPKGKVSLLDLFEGRRQLMLYHFMFAPSVAGWPDAGVRRLLDGDRPVRPSGPPARARCVILPHLARAAEEYRGVQKRMGWTLPWYSSEGSDFNKDFGLTTPKGEIYGLSVFIRDGNNIYRTYFTNGRGVEGLNVWTLLDLLPFGRQEEWEDSPTGVPQGKPYAWWRRHDEYDKKDADAH